MGELITDMTAWGVRQVIESARLQLIQNNIEALDAQIGNWRARIHSERLTGSGTFSVSNIDQSYDHLVILGLLQSTHTTFDHILARANGDTGNNYVGVNNSGAFGPISSFFGTQSYIEGDDDLDGFSPFEMIIYDYAATNRHKSFLYRTVGIAAGAVRVGGGRWKSNSAITALTFAPVTGANFVADCSLAVIGVSL